MISIISIKCESETLEKFVITDTQYFYMFIRTTYDESSVKMLSIIKKPKKNVIHIKQKKPKKI